MAHAAYLSLLGDLAAAIAEFEALLPAFKIREQVSGSSGRSPARARRSQRPRKGANAA
jgi:hypothetical protein